MTARKILVQALVVLLAVAAGGAGTYYWLTGGMHPPAAGGPGDSSREEKKYTCPMHPFIVNEQPGACPICGMTLVPVKSASAAEAGEGKKERKIKYWVAPMDPNYRSDRPGKSPMGMDLVPVYEDAEGEAATIRVDPNVIQSIGVRTAPVRIDELRKTIRTVGMVEYDESRVSSVNTKIGGWIEKLRVDKTGQEVRKGEPLIEIYSPDLVSAQQEYLVARRHFEQVKNSPFPQVVEGARELLESARTRLAYWDITDRQVEELAATGTIRKTLTIHSPFRGVVVHKAAFEGTKVMPGMELFRIADLSRVWIQGDVYEYELPWVKAGVPATVTLDYIPGETFRGVVAYVYPYLEGKTRTATVRVELPNRGNLLKPDMFAHIELHPQGKGKTVLVPSEAVIRSGIRNVVFVARGEGRFEPREVKLGLEGEGGTVQILSGLREGENVVVSSQFLLDSESNLKEALKKFESAAGEKSREEGGAAPSSTEGSGPGGGEKGMPPMKGMESPAESREGN